MPLNMPINPLDPSEPEPCESRSRLNFAQLEHLQIVHGQRDAQGPSLAGQASLAATSVPGLPLPSDSCPCHVCSSCRAASHAFVRQNASRLDVPGAGHSRCVHAGNQKLLATPSTMCVADVCCRAMQWNRSFHSSWMVARGGGLWVKMSRIILKPSIPYH